MMDVAEAEDWVLAFAYNFTCLERATLIKIETVADEHVFAEVFR